MCLMFLIIEINCDSDNVYIFKNYRKNEAKTYLQIMLALPSWYWPFGPQRRGNTSMATPRGPLNARNDPSWETVSFSTVKFCVADGCSV